MLQNAILRTCCPYPVLFVQGVKIFDVSAALFAEKFRFSASRPGDTLSPIDAAYFAISNE